MTQPEKTNPTAFELSAIQWAANNLARQECAERGEPTDGELFHSLMKQERSRIAGSRDEIDAIVQRYKAFSNVDGERRRETPQSEQQFYRDFPAIPYDPTLAEGIEPPLGRPAYDELDRATQRAVSSFVQHDMGLSPGSISPKRLKEYRMKCEAVAKDPFFIEEAIRFDRDCPREI